MSSVEERNLEADGQDLEQVERAKEIFRLLLKGIKNINLYKHAESRQAEYLTPAHQALTRFLEEWNAFPLKLTPYTLEHKGQVIYEEETKENLTYKFYRDGMRLVTFRRGLTLDELRRFVLVALETPSEAALRQEDMITRLWKEDLGFVDFVVMEGFGVGDLSESEAELAVERILAYLRTQLASKGDEFARFARLSVGDLELELSDVEQVRAALISGETAREEDYAWAQDEIQTQDKKLLLPKWLFLVFQILLHEASREDMDAILEGLVQALDTLLLSEDIAGAVALFSSFAMTLQRAGEPERRMLIASAQTEFMRRMVEPHRLDAVGRYLQLSKSVDLKPVRQYLTACGPQEVVILRDMLLATERPEGRVALVEVLSQLGKDHVHLFAEHLGHKSSNVVRDMLSIILKIDPPEKLKLFGQCLKHPNMLIRLDALKMLARSPEPEALEHIQTAMADPDLQMRLGAYRAFATRSPAQAASVLTKLIGSRDYLRKEERERVAIATALGETKTKEALEFLAEILGSKRSLFARGKQRRLKMIAVAGLQAMRNRAAFDVLAAAVKSRRNTRSVALAAKKAALFIKAELERAARRSSND